MRVILDNTLFSQSAHLSRNIGLKLWVTSNIQHEHSLHLSTHFNECLITLNAHNPRENIFYQLSVHFTINTRNSTEFHNQNISLSPIRRLKRAFKSPIDISISFYSKRYPQTKAVKAFHAFFFFSLQKSFNIFFFSIRKH